MLNLPEWCTGSEDLGDLWVHVDVEISILSYLLAPDPQLFINPVLEVFTNDGEDHVGDVLSV